MAQEGLYETVCPACNGAFDVAADAAQGNCPHCNAFLRFIEEENVPAPAPQAEPIPEAAPEPPIASEPMPAPEPEAPAPSPPPGPGEFRVECPQCRHAFNVGASLQEAHCPACAAPLVLEDVIAERGIEFPVACPACSRLHEVPIDRQEGRCPHCHAQLQYEDVFPGQPTAVEAPAPAPPAPEASLPSQPEPEPVAVAPPEPEPAPEPAAAVATPPPPPAPSSDGLPLASVDPGGIPLAIDCPSCKRAFGVPPGAKEGNCPHCNIPLAFVTEKEHLELQVAEERKRRMQQKLAAKRARLKAKDEERRAKEEAARPEPKPVELASTETPKRRFGIFRRGGAGKEAPPEAQGPSGAAAVEEAPVQIEMAAEAPAIVIEAPTQVAETPASPPAKTGRSKKSKEPAAPPAEVQVEAAPIEIAAEAPTIEVQMDAPVQEPHTEIVIEASPEAAPTTEPAKPKKSLFGRFRKEKPAEAAPTATVEASSEPIIMMESPAVEAVPEPKPTKKGKKAAPEPTPVEAAIEMSFDAAPEPAPAPKRGKREPAPAAVVEEAAISFESEAPSAAEPEVSIEMEAPAQASAAIIETGDIVFDAPATAPEKPTRRRRR